MVKVIPSIIEGKASGIRTLVIICGTVAPIERLSSITPLSTSFKLLSMILATKGAAATESGTIVAVVPIVVPTSILDSGKTKIIKIKNGKDLRIFMILPRILLNIGFSQILSFSVITSRTPKGNPISKERTAEAKTIYKV
jgi:hypothetical protein